MNKVTYPVDQLESKVQSLLMKGMINEMFSFLDTIIEKESNEVLAAINKIMSLPFNLYVLIYHILQDENLLRKVENESYYHENGFHKIVLGAGRFFKLRLHHFGCNAKIPMENIHDHRWAFASSVLSGRLKMDLFQVSKSKGESLLHYRYNSVKSSGSYGTEFLGMTRLSVIQSREFVAGEQYLMSTRDLHRITNQPGEESITLILTGKPISQLCNLYAKREIRDDEKTPVKYGKDHLKFMLSELSEKIHPLKN